MPTCCSRLPRTGRIAVSPPSSGLLLRYENIVLALRLLCFRLKNFRKFSSCTLYLSYTQQPDCAIYTGCELCAAIQSIEVSSSVSGGSSADIMSSTAAGFRREFFVTYEDSMCMRQASFLELNHLYMSRNCSEYLIFCSSFH